VSSLPVLSSPTISSPVINFKILKLSILIPYNVNMEACASMSLFRKV
jgi:hypothetical protein